MISNQVQATTLGKPFADKQEKVEWELKAVSQRATFFPNVRQYDGVEITNAMPEQSLEHLWGRTK